MKLERLALILMLAPVAGATAAFAQAPDGEKNAGAVEVGEPSETIDDGAITVLDQVVPVSEDPATLLDSEDIGPAAAEANPDDTPLTEEERLARIVEAFNSFVELKDSGVYDEAENVAKQVIELSIRHFGPTSNDTARALGNLGHVQHLNENYEAAQQNFEAAIEIIEDNEDRLNAMLVNPLTGLGSAQLASGRPDLAARSYERAVHISHVNEGPHNLDQVEILQSLAEANLRLGDLEAAKNNQDMIYSLNLRYYSDNAIRMVPSLMRRAEWQRRTGYILDERATYRRIIRIIEATEGKDDLQLVEPLLELGESYFFVDTADTQAQFHTTTSASGEMYFKRAVRIAEENPDADWQIEARTKLALGDYYNYLGDTGRARRSYREAWDILSEDNESRLAYRRAQLERPVLLRQNPIPRYVGSAKASDRAAGDPNLREGRVVASYEITSRGRVSSLQVVESTPDEFEDVRRSVQRELRNRIYRPRFVEADPIDTADQVFTHTFYYQQPDLQEMRAEAMLDDR